MLFVMTDIEDAPTAAAPPPYTGLVPSTGAGVIGVDVGGSGIKAAPVDVENGTLTAERVRLETPHPSTPQAIAATVAEVVGTVVQECGPGAIAPQAAVGLTLPSVIRGGQVLTAANIDPAWIGLHAVDLFSEALGRPVVVVNDADAAGVAEVRFGAGRDVEGVVLMLTLGTGIGSALFVDGHLVPNTELGHLPLRGGDAERYAASSVRKAEGLSMKKYAKRLQEYLELVERLIWPDVILIGGGISKRADEFLPHVQLDTPVQPAQLRNEAGIVGAALLTPT